MVFDKPTAQGRRLNAPLAQIRVSEFLLWTLGSSLHQRTDVFGRFVEVFQWFADFAWAVTFENRRFGIA